MPGLQLCELFYQEVVKDPIERAFPDLPYSAGLLDSGSEVLGFDTERSTDHHWGPRLLLFLSSADIRKKKKISDHLSKNLPSTFRGYSTHFGDPDALGVQLLSEAKEGQPIRHRIEIHTTQSFFKQYLSIDPTADLTAADWLTLSAQILRTIRSGKTFHDALDLESLRNKLQYFPEDVWLFLMASEWMNISQEEPFVGRAGDVEDEMGSKIIAARLVQSIMRLCFLMEKEYAPYSKWFGTAFAQLRCAPELAPILEKVLAAEHWKEREEHLSRAYTCIARMHNDLCITPPLPTDVSRFFDRPYRVIHGGVFAAEIRKLIRDPAIKSIAAPIGSVDQLSNTVDLLENDKLRKKLKCLYR